MAERAIRLRKGMRVYVQWLDISADLHTDEEIKPAEAELVGWIEKVDRKVLTLTYCRYLDGCSLKDGISLPRGVVTKVEKI